MLYERWLQVVRECGSETALRDLGSGRRWTFRELEAAVPSTPTDEAVLFPQGQDAGFILTVLKAWRADRPICPLEPDQPQPNLGPLPAACRLVKTTSATTSAARFVLFTAAQMAADPDQIVPTMGLRRDSPNLGVISLAHSYGFSNLVLPLLLHGIPLVLAPSVLPEIVRHAASTGGNWTLAAVPALWRAWHEANAIPDTTRLAISAGAPLPLPLERSIHDATGLKLHNFLGSSECGGIAYDRSDIPRADAAVAGSAMEGVRLERDEDGCLAVRSPAVGTTYWPESDDRLGDGCFRTRDLVELREGLVHLQGRASDLINVAGRKVSPETIERVLLTHGEVADCLVLGVPSNDAERVEWIAAVIVPRGEVSIESLKHHVLEHLPAWQLPKVWRTVDSLGVNQRGKLSRADWRQRLVTA